MSQKTEDDTETQADASDGSATTFHESVNGYVSNSTGNGPTIGYSHITHIYNMNLGAVRSAPESCCNCRHFTFVISLCADSEDLSMTQQP